MKIKQNLRFVFFIAFIGYASIYIGRLNFSIASAAFTSAGQLDKAQIGVISSIFAFAYAVSKVLNGYLGDVFRAKSIIVLGLVLAGLSNLCIWLDQGYHWICLWWGINACGQAMIWGPLLRAIKENYDADEYRSISQRLGISIPVGSIIGLWLASVCTARFSVKVSFLVPALLLFTAAAVVEIGFIDTIAKKPEKKQLNLFLPLQRLFAQTRMRQMIAPIVIHGMIKDNITFWMALYFVETYQISISEIAGFVFFVPLLSLIGKASYTFLFRLLKDDYTISILSFLGCSACAFLLAFFRLPAAIAVILLGLIAAFVAIINTHFLALYPLEVADKENLSFTISIMDLLTYGGAGLGSLLFRRLITEHGFSSMYAVWFAAAFISALLLEFITR